MQAGMNRENPGGSFGGTMRTGLEGEQVRMASGSPRSCCGSDIPRHRVLRQWMSRFPSTQAPRAASEQEVIQAWEGLGTLFRAKHAPGGAVHRRGGKTSLLNVRRPEEAAASGSTASLRASLLDNPSWTPMP